jgi:bacterial/archaeal transporter family-2 protein
MAAILLSLFGLVGGAASALQSAVNGRLGTLVGPLNAAMVSTAVGLTTLLAFSTATRQLSVGQMLKSPPLLLIGGALGAFFVTSVIFVVPRLGVVTAVVLAIIGQLIVALLTDQFGLFGNPRIHISLTRALGVALVLAGFALARS